MSMNKVQPIKIGLDMATAPSFELTSNELPQIKDWKAGEKYNLVLEVEMASKKEGEDYEWEKQPKGLVRGRFKIKAVGAEEEDEMEYGDEFAMHMGGHKMS